MAAKPPPLELTCQDVIGLLVEYLEAAVTPEVLLAFEQHLQDCAQCVAYLNTYRTTRDLTVREGRVEMPEEMRTRLRDLLLERLGGRGTA